MLKYLVAAGLLIVTAGAHASTTIVNLSAGPNSPNAGNSSGSYPYNPVNVTLAAGTYSASIVGIAGGGLYDAYTVYAPSGNNGAYTDSMWSFTLNNGASAAFTQSGALGRFNTASAALAAYAPGGTTFTLASAQTVSFYIDDTASPYFNDDSGGVSLAVSAVPEPAAIALFVVGIAGLGFTMRNRVRGINTFA